MKYILSWEKVEDVNTFRSSWPHAVQVLDDMNEVNEYISWCSKHEGYPSVKAYLERSPVYLYTVPTGQRLMGVGH